MSLADEQAVNEVLEQLTNLLQENEIIQNYQQIKQRVDQNKNLRALEDAMEAAQKEAVQFAHYGKPEAEQAAIRRADDLKKQIDTHPQVVAYRDALYEANDLLQHLTTMIQKEVNDAMEEEH
ncbi:YlbF family regulator [Enterococcus alishanensis]